MKTELILNVIDVNSSDFPALVTATFMDNDKRVWILRDKEPVLAGSNTELSHKTSIEVSLARNRVFTIWCHSHYRYINSSRFRNYLWKQSF